MDWDDSLLDYTNVGIIKSISKIQYCVQKSGNINKPSSEENEMNIKKI